jgi:hypothetical protein
MAYQTGTATTIHDLLDRFRLFLAAQGWTEAAWSAEGTGRRLHMSKGGTYVHFRSFQNEAPHTGAPTTETGIAMTMSTGYTPGATEWQAQPVAPVPPSSTTRYSMACTVARAQTNIEYRFLADPSGDHLVLLARRTGDGSAHGQTAWFNYLVFGRSIIKGGTWAGGQYMSGVRMTIQINSNSGGLTNAGHSIVFHPHVPFDNVSEITSGSDSGHGAGGFIRADVDTFVNGWVSNGTTTSTGTGYTGKRFWTLNHTLYQYPSGTPSRGRSGPSTMPRYEYMSERQESSIFAGTVLLPYTAWVERDGGGISLLGEIPFLYSANTAHFDEGSIHTIGDAEYLMLHMWAIRLFR